MIFVLSAEPHASQDHICIGKYCLPLMIYLLFQIIHELAEANANILILMVLLYNNGTILSKTETGIIYFFDY